MLCQAHLYEADVKISRSLPSQSESASLFTVNISICNIDVFNIGCVYIIYSACIYAWQFSVCLSVLCLFVESWLLFQLVN